MAILKEEKLESMTLSTCVGETFSCDICGSDDITETNEGFTCRTCGIVLEIKKFEYHKPYNEDIIQHAVLGKTQMGNNVDRSKFENSVHLDYLSKLDSIRSYEEIVKVEAKIEIRRILTGLHFPLSDVQEILRKFTKIRPQLGAGTKYRSPAMLVPLVIYFFYKQKGNPIDEIQLLELAKISKKDYQAFKLSMIAFWPEYQKRDRMEYIAKRILELVQLHSLGMPFYYQSKKIMHRFYEFIKNTKDDVIVGLVTSITLLCSDQNDICINHLCETLNIKMSTIQMQVKKNFFDRFRVPGFISLVKSADILRKVMQKLDVLTEAFTELETSEEVIPTIIHVELGSASPVHNFLSHQLLYKDETGYIRVSIVKDESIHKELFDNPIKSDMVALPEMINVEVWKYHWPTGPPQAVT